MALEFSEIQSEAAMHQAIGRRFLALIEGELEFAAKKGSKGKGGANKKDCKKGLSCGSSCVAKTKACVSEMSASQKKRYYALLRKVKKGGAGSGEAQAEIDKIIADQVLAKTGQQQKSDSISKIEEAADGFMVTPGNTLGGIMKVGRMQSEFGLTSSEARAVSTWISVENSLIAGELRTKYSIMNQAIYAPGSLPKKLQDQADATNQLAIAGYNKLPSITPEIIRDLTDQIGDKTFSPDNPLTRHIKIDNPEAFVRRYQNSIGKTLVEETHFATTHLQNLWAADDSNVTFKVAAKWDGTGQGKYLEPFKNKAYEGEVMYPPGSNFRVKSVTPPDASAKNSPLGDVVLAFDLAEAGGASNWQVAFKQLKGKAAYDALPPELKAKTAKSKKAITAWIDSQRSIRKDWVIELEEV